MGSIAYTAARALLGGVSIGDPITRDVGFRDAVPTTRRYGPTAVSLSGVAETIVERVETRWAVTTASHTDADRGWVQQWIQSVIGGETWTIDFRGSLASPSNAIAVRLVSTSVVETRLGAGLYRVSLELVQ